MKNEIETTVILQVIENNGGVTIQFPQIPSENKKAMLETLMKCELYVKAIKGKILDKIYSTPPTSDQVDALLAALPPVPPVPSLAESQSTDDQWDYMNAPLLN